MSKKQELVELETKSLELETKKFELEQRQAKALSVSAFFPDPLKNDVASAVIIYDLSKRMNISVMEVSQSIYIIYGRPSFSTTFLVARLNQSGLIKGALRTVVSNDKQKAYCVAIDAESGEEMVGMEVTMDMARAEGWVDKKGSKWKTMPELMLRKRSQSFFIKEYYPEVMFGLSSSEEIQDVEAIDVEIARPTADINRAITTKDTSPTNAEAKTCRIQEDNTQEPNEKKVTRVPRYVSKHYETLEEYGIKKNQLRNFVDYMDWMGQPESVIDRFFSQTPAEINTYTNAFYGIEEATEAEYEEVNPESDPSPEVESPNVPTAAVSQTQESNTQEPKAGAVSMARYNGQLIAKGLKPEDITPFLEWAGVNETNIAQFISDTEAVNQLIAQFNIEAGYAE